MGIQILCRVAVLIVCFLHWGCDTAEPQQSKVDAHKPQQSQVIDKRRFQTLTGADLASLAVIDNNRLSTRIVKLENGSLPRPIDARVFYNVHMNSAQELTQFWKDVDFELTAIPNLSVESFPLDMQGLPVPVKKEVFFRSLLPHVLSHNATILERRNKLNNIRTRQGQLSPSDRFFVETMADYYRLETYSGPLATLADTLNVLLIRADSVPPSLALAQAAIESGWGTSRFAREGNNLYGQRVIAGEAPGLVAKERKKAWFQIAKFPTVGASLRSYVRNLNTHPSYSTFRQIRYDLRSQNKAQESSQLVRGLEKYSTRGHDYTADILRIIRQNQLTQYDRAKLLPLQFPQ